MQENNLPLTNIDFEENDVSQSGKFKAPVTAFEN